MSENEFILTYRKLIMPDDLNHAKSLFGGRLLQWADEAAVLYAMCQTGSKSLVTLKMSEALFKNPAFSGDVIEFWTRKSKIGKSSLSVDCVVVRKDFDSPQDIPKAPIIDNNSGSKNIILRCEFSFVHIGPSGKPEPHKLAKN
jgi:acyl-CoA hydrolase